MTIPENVLTRADVLVREGQRIFDDLGEATGQGPALEAVGWVVSVVHLMETIFPFEDSPHRMAATNFAADDDIPTGIRVGKILSVLRTTVDDIEAGMLASIADTARWRRLRGLHQARVREARYCSEGRRH